MLSGFAAGIPGVYPVLSVRNMSLIYQQLLGDFQKRISHISQYDPATRSEQDKNLLSSLGYSFLEIALKVLREYRWREIWFG